MAQPTALPDHLAMLAPTATQVLLVTPDPTAQVPVVVAQATQDHQAMLDLRAHQAATTPN